MTRIIAGTAGGRRLAVPPGERTRPTSDRVREGMFSTLRSLRGRFDGARVLDLYAGSGAVALEALSRGAAHARLVESDARAAKVAKANAHDLGFDGDAAVTVAKVERLVSDGPAPGEEPYDIVFCDPPYALADDDVIELLAALADGGWLATGAYVIVERDSRAPAPKWPEGAEALASRRYGETMLHYGRWQDLW